MKTHNCAVNTPLRSCVLNNTNNNAKPQHHWIQPRLSIATTLAQHDIAYATHGALQAMEMIAELDLTPSTMKRMTVLDYGCGTGRIGRVLTPIFKHVYAYDPVIETVQHGAREAAPLTFRNHTMSHLLDGVPEVDVAFSVNVIEHLSNQDAMDMIDNLKRLVRGPTVLWYAPLHNSDVLAPYLTADQKLADAAFIARDKGSIVVRVVNFRDEPGAA